MSICANCGDGKVLEAKDSQWDTLYNTIRYIITMQHSSQQTIQLNKNNNWLSNCMTYLFIITLVTLPIPSQITYTLFNVHWMLWSHCPLYPTRFGACNILDLVFTDIYNLISDLEVLCPFSTSDHNMVKFIANIPCVSNTNKTVVNELYSDFKIANYEMIETYLCGIDSAYEFSFAFNVQNYLNIFLNHLHISIDLKRMVH